MRCCSRCWPGPMGSTRGNMAPRQSRIATHWEEAPAASRLPSSKRALVIRSRCRKSMQSSAMGQTGSRDWAPPFALSNSQDPDGTDAVGRPRQHCDLAKYVPFAHDLEDGLSALAGRHANADASLQDGPHALARCPFGEDSGSGGVSSSMRRCEDGIGILVAQSGEQESASEEIAPLGECGSDQICPPISRKSGRWALPLWSDFCARGATSSD